MVRFSLCKQSICDNEPPFAGEGNGVQASCFLGAHDVTLIEGADFLTEDRSNVVEGYKPLVVVALGAKRAINPGISMFHLLKLVACGE